MPALTQPLRDEHRELLPSVELLRIAAEAVGRAPVTELGDRVDAAYEFLSGHLIPHALAEDEALYPVVARVMGAPDATRTMSRDHVEVGGLTEELLSLRARLPAVADDVAVADGLRRVLYGLYALVRVHFAKEEEIYLPLLDARLAPAEARAMFDAMESAAAAAKDRRVAL
jgi:iron-sulfur cluster repair protein YtfE (RIC family)